MEKSEWKIISKELPKKEEEVLVYLKNSAGHHVTTLYFDGKHFVDTCESMESGHAIVSHWMEMPEPPKQTPTAH